MKIRKVKFDKKENKIEILLVTHFMPIPEALDIEKDK